jgi:phosphoribosylglycinamide formyltransferase-1
MLELVRSHSIDLLVLAGYMKKVPPALLAVLKNRVLNIHPALLPAFGGEGFYGARVHEGVIARGAQFSGITIHMVNEAYDEGQIILQRMVPVPFGCTAEELASRVLTCEHAFYWQVIAGFAREEIKPTSSEDPARAVDLSLFRARMDADDGR